MYSANCKKLIVNDSSYEKMLLDIFISNDKVSNK